MANIIKDKNMLIITNEVNGIKREYKFDCNIGVMYGTKGTPIHATPAGMNDAIYRLGRLDGNDPHYHNVYGVLHLYKQRFKGVVYGNLEGYKDKLVSDMAVLDKLESIGYKVPYYDIDLTLIAKLKDNKAFKLFSKYYKDTHHSINDFFIDYDKELWKGKYNIKASEHLTEAMVNRLYKLTKGRNYTVEFVDILAYYMERGAFEMFDPSDGDEWNSRNFFSLFVDIVRNMFSFAEKLHCKVEKTPDLMKQYSTLARNYKVQKEAINVECLAKQYGKHLEALSFENEIFEVIIPKCVDDFKNEASHQQNCVFSMYLPKVLKGETNVVFIRRKSNKTTPYITCEVDNYGTIRQYLTRFNNRPTEADARAFYEEYSRHLVALWR